MAGHQKTHISTKVPSAVTSEAAELCYSGLKEAKEALCCTISADMWLSKWFSLHTSLIPFKERRSTLSDPNGERWFRIQPSLMMFADTAERLTDAFLLSEHHSPATPICPWRQMDSRVSSMKPTDDPKTDFKPMLLISWPGGFPGSVDECRGDAIKLWLKSDSHMLHGACLFQGKKRGWWDFHV